MIRVFNTLSGKKEGLKKPKGKQLKLFVCGPTVYDYPHIGNARTYIAFDAFVRYLRSQKIKVFYLQNITDIDDKIITKAREEKTTPAAIAKKYEKIYHQNEKSLNICSVSKYARATAHIPQIIKQVKTLIKKGSAYKIEDDGYYFDLAAFPEYGKLSKRTSLQAEDAVSRIDENIRKRNKGDFALWKLVRFEATNYLSKSTNSTNKFKIINGEPAWWTPLGWGRPGWHIEDTAITEHYFGPQYDLHGGAVDLKFPHHEAEIAQQESASGKKPLVKLWMHTGFLLINGKKMSKSLGNFVSITEFLKNYPGEVLRLLVLNHHYRSPVDYTDETAKQSQSALKSMQEFIWKLNLPAGSGLKDLPKLLLNTKKIYGNSLADDFNTPEALATLFSLKHNLEKQAWNLTASQAKQIQRFLINSLSALGLNLKNLPKIPAKIGQMAQKRELCRINKQFIQSDALRNEIEKLGYIIEDTPAGPLVIKK